MKLSWSKEDKLLVKEMWPTHSAGQISAFLKKEKKVTRSRNAIMGLVHRMRLPCKETIQFPATKPRVRAPIQPYIPIRPYKTPPRPIKPPQKWNGKSVSLLDAAPYQCRAIVNSSSHRNGDARVCGAPIVSGSPFSFCAYHHKQYTVASRGTSYVSSLVSSS